jgi:hypothetical protein
MRTTFSNVRLYHLLDLLRLLVDSQSTGNLSNDAFALMVLAILNPFASAREFYGGLLLSPPASTLAQDSGVPPAFYSRWCTCPQISLPDFEDLLAPPSIPMPEPLALELRPKVSPVHMPSSSTLAHLTTFIFN